MHEGIMTAFPHGNNQNDVQTTKTHKFMLFSALFVVHKLPKSVYLFCYKGPKSIQLEEDR